MALEQSDVSALLDALRTGDGADLVRDLIRLVLQKLIEAEAVSVIGAGLYERTDGRLTGRNGHRAKTLAPRPADLDLKIPKLRRGNYFPSFLEPRRRIEALPPSMSMSDQHNHTASPRLAPVVARKR